MQEHRLLFVVVWIDVVNLIDFLCEEAGSVQRYPGFCCFKQSFQLQHDCVCHEADADVGFDSVQEPVVHGTDVQVRLAEAEGTLYHKEIPVFFYHLFVRQRTVGRVPFIPVQKLVFGDLVIVNLDGRVSLQREEAVVTAVVQLVLCDFVRPEASSACSRDDKDASPPGF